MDRSPYAKLRRVILASMILVPLTVFMLILGIGYYYFTTSLEFSAVATITRIVEDHRQMIDSFLSNRKANLEFVLDSYTFEKLADPEELHHILSSLQKESSTFVDLGLFDQQGIHLNYQGPFKLAGKDYAKAPWFKEVIKKGQYISDIFLGIRRIPHFIIALKREEAGKTWVIRSTIDSYMFNELVEKIRIGKTGEAYLLSVDDIFQTEQRSGGNLMQKNSEVIKTPLSHTGIKTFIEKNSRGDEFLYATTWLENKNWLLVVRQEKADAFRFLHSATNVIVLITIVGGGAIVGIAFLLTGGIVKRMERLDTEREQLGSQLIRASRLAELGEMATGFAHEINNPLQIMKSEHALMDSILSELKEKGVLEMSESLSEFEESMEQIDLQIGRCAAITQSILKFGRQSDPVVENIALQKYIPEITTMVEKKAAVQGIAITQEISEDTPPIHGDRGQLQQVLLNLYNNAMDAIIARHGARGGELLVGTKAKEDGKVEIFVRDNGSGITPEDRKKIFSPFFTTKPVGKGTGLGLSVCYGIIDKMGGIMEVESEKGVGTTFTILLPTAEQTLTN